MRTILIPVSTKSDDLTIGQRLFWWVWRRFYLPRLFARWGEVLNTAPNERDPLTVIQHAHACWLLRDAGIAPDAQDDLDWYAEGFQDIISSNDPLRTAFTNRWAAYVRI